MHFITKLFGNLSKSISLNPSKIYWSDSKNIELYHNRGIIRQRGNTLLLQLPTPEGIKKLCELEADGEFKLIIVTDMGKIYVYSDKTKKVVA